MKTKNKTALLSFLLLSISPVLAPARAAAESCSCGSGFLGIGPSGLLGTGLFGQSPSCQAYCDQQQAQGATAAANKDQAQIDATQQSITTDHKNVTAACASGPLSAACTAATSVLVNDLQKLAGQTQTLNQDGAAAVNDEKAAATADQKQATADAASGNITAQTADQQAVNMRNATVQAKADEMKTMGLESNTAPGSPLFAADQKRIQLDQSIEAVTNGLAAKSDASAAQDRAAWQTQSGGGILGAIGGAVGNVIGGIGDAFRGVASLVVDTRGHGGLEPAIPQTCDKGMPDCVKNGLKYQPVSGTLFGPGNSVSPADIAQGEIGDCYLMSSLAEIAQNDPAVIRNMIQQNKDGTYTVTFQRPRPSLAFWEPDFTPVKVTVDGNFPETKNGPAYAQEGQGAVLWPMVLEKAYASFQGSYGQIGEGGQASTAMEAITGRHSAEYNPSSASLNALASLEAHGQAVVVGTKSDYTDPLGKKILVPSHAYWVKSVDQAQGTVTLGNPWGWGDTVTLTIAQFQQLMGSLYVDPTS